MITLSLITCGTPSGVGNRWLPAEPHQCLLCAMFAVIIEEVRISYGIALDCTPARFGGDPESRARQCPTRRRRDLTSWLGNQRACAHSPGDGAVNLAASGSARSGDTRCQQLGIWRRTQIFRMRSTAS